MLDSLEIITTDTIPSIFTSYTCIKMMCAKVGKLLGLM